MRKIQGNHAGVPDAITGAAALYLESYPDATPCDVASALIGTATEGALSLTKRAVDSHTPNRLLHVGPE